MRTAAGVVVLLGAAASLALMFHVGRHNRSVVLLLLFTIWVISPFAGLLWSGRLSSPRVQLMVSLILTVVSLAAYAGVAFGPTRRQPAGVFLMTPLASWVVMAITAIISRKPR